MKDKRGFGNHTQEKVGQKVHGKWKSKEWNSWNHIKGRCLRPNHVKFPIYGGRGIRVCERWTKFGNFFEDMGVAPSPTHSIDRKDNDGNYSCGKCDECLRNGWVANCRWATPKEQANNRRKK